MEQRIQHRGAEQRHRQPEDRVTRSRLVTTEAGKPTRSRQTPKPSSPSRGCPPPEPGGVVPRSPAATVSSDASAARRQGHPRLPVPATAGRGGSGCRQGPMRQEPPPLEPARSQPPLERHSPCGRDLGRLRWCRIPLSRVASPRAGASTSRWRRASPSSGPDPRAQTRAARVHGSSRWRPSGRPELTAVDAGVQVGHEVVGVAALLR